MSMISDSLYQLMLSELTEGHLALDRLGSPREIDDGGEVRELELAERIAALSSAYCADENRK